MEGSVVELLVWAGVALLVVLLVVRFAVRWVVRLLILGALSLAAAAWLAGSG